MKRLTVLFLSFIFIAISASSALATSYYVTGDRTYTSNTTTKNPYTGENITRTAYAQLYTLSGNNSTLYAFCIEPYHTTSTNQTYNYNEWTIERYVNDSGSIMTQSKLDKIGLLFTASHSVLGDGKYQAAVQMILKEIMMDDNFNSFSNGTFVWNDRTTSPFRNEVNDLLNRINTGNYNPADTYSFSILQNGNGLQDLLVFEYTPSAVPAPAAFWLIGSGISGLMILRRKLS